MLPAPRGGEVGEQLNAGQLQMMPGYRFVEGRRFQVPSRYRRWAAGIEPARPGSAAVRAGCTTCSAAAVVPRFIAVLLFQ
jgi:hypothetical protein